MFLAKDLAVGQIHRLLVRGGQPNLDAVGSLWADAFRRAGGKGPPPKEGLLWLGAYVAVNPFGLGVRRRPAFVELPLRAEYLGCQWQARPDLLAEEPDGALVACEFTAARHPLLDLSSLRVMAAIDQLVLRRSTQWPLVYRERTHRVRVCSLESWQEADITLTGEEGRAVLAEVVIWLRQLAEHHPATPSAEVWGGCPFRQTCNESWWISNRDDGANAAA